MALIAGILSGYFNAFLRAALIQISLEDGKSAFTTYFYISIIIPTALLKLAIYNSSMSIYDQSENGPIFASFFIVIQIISGAIILDEIQLYTSLELFKLIVSSFICILGIYILAIKPGQEIP